MTMDCEADRSSNDVVCAMLGQDSSRSWSQMRLGNTLTFVVTQASSRQAKPTLSPPPVSCPSPRAANHVNCTWKSER